MRVDPVPEWETPAETPIRTIDQELAMGGRIDHIALGDLRKKDLRERCIAETLIKADVPADTEVEVISRNTSVTVVIGRCRVTAIEWQGMVDLYIGTTRARSEVFAKRLIQCGKY